MSGRRLNRIAAAAAAFAIAGCGDGEDGAGERPPVAAGAPNIVLVVTDDQPLASFSAEVLPNVFEQIVEPGTSFTEAAVTIPLCCPSRATMLTGQYPHNHGILDNYPGYPTFAEPEQTLPAWLQEAGYLTGHFGKWLHGYEDVGGAEPAPGWDRWVTQLDPRVYYDYELSVDGEVESYGSSRRDYLTTVLSREASSWVARRAGDRPLYVQLDYYAPHGAGPHKRETASCQRSAEPLFRDFEAAAGASVPRSAAFNEADVSDKPPWYRGLPALSTREIAAIDEKYRCAVAALAAADRGFGDLVDALREAGELDDTAFVFASDNGYFLGEHRMGAPRERNLKQRPLEETLHVPLAVRLPAGDAEQPPTVDLQVSLLDVAPTILELAGAEPCVGGECRTVDGRSLAGLAAGKDEWPRERAVLFEYDALEPDGAGPTVSCAYEGLRTTRDLYVRHTEIPGPDGCGPDGAPVFEHYDLERDPLQLENLATREPGLERRLDALIACAGTDGLAACE